MRLLLTVSVLCAAGCAPAPGPSAVQQLAQQPTPVEAPVATDDSGALAVMRLLGKDRAGAVSRAWRAQSYRLEAYAGGEGVDGDLHGHKVTAAGPELSKAQLEQLRRLIFDASSYDFRSEKACEFVPGVAIRLYAKNPELQPIDLLLCFSCDEWAFANIGDTVSEDFDPVQPQLLALCQALFPADAALSRLKPKKGK